MALKSLRTAIGGLNSRASNDPLAKGFSEEALEEIFQKYDFPLEGSPGQFLEYFSMESERLLTPSVVPGATNPLLHALFPEAAFPHIPNQSFFPNSLTDLILDTLSPDKREGPEAAGLLHLGLKTAMIPFIVEDLGKDIRFLINGELLPCFGEDVINLTRQLDPGKASKVVLLAVEKDLPGPFEPPSAEFLQKGLPAGTRLVPIANIRNLPAIARHFFEEYSTPVTVLEPRVVVFSRSPVAVLGSLVCGFSVASSPPLPIHGSEQVERFFSEDLKRYFGSHYYPLQTGKMDPAWLEGTGEC